MPDRVSLPNPLSPLVARELVKTYGDRVVLDGVHLVAAPGRPLGLVGENGAGKSTLMRILAGVDAPDSGTVRGPADLGYLGQEPDLPAGATVGDVLAEALAPLHEAVARLPELAADLGRRPGAEDDYEATLAWATWHDAWDADRRAERVAARLGLGRLDRSRPVTALSGGERSRLALAALLTRRPECVLLDEPTNHLDDQAMTLLEESVTSMPGVVVAASHDRTFLDAVCGVVVDLDPVHLGLDGTGGARFGGGYSSYLVAKREAELRWRTAFAAHQEQLDALRESTRRGARQVAHNRAPRDNDRFIHAFKGGNVERAVSRRVRDAERRIEVLERDPVPPPPKPIEFSGLRTPGRGAGGGTATVRDLRVTGRLDVPRLDVSPGEHLLVTGANGSGKSSLLAVLAGRLAPTAGTVSVSARRTGYLPQDVTFSRPDLSAREVYDAATRAGVPLTELGLLHPRDLGRPVAVLSVGQQRRLGLAILVARAPDLLLLDEPTNHVSLKLAEELEEALMRSPVSVVVASHDRWLRRRWDASELGLSRCAG